MIIDVSGYSYSGKGAVIDILRDFPSLEVHKKEFEFLLVRISDGLLDLRSTLINNPSEIRNDMAIKRFIELIKNLTAQPTSIIRPGSIFTPPGQDYEKIFPNFYNHSMDFVNSICSITYEYWPFPSLYKSNVSSFHEKIKKLLTRKDLTKKFSVYETKEEFDSLMSNYLRKILYSNLFHEKNKVVTSNMLEVYSPVDFFNAIQPCKLIIVDRDPRAIYVSIPGNRNKLNDINHANEFITKFKYQRSKKFLKNLEHKNILVLNFEDIFIDFENFISKISIFLDESMPSKFNNFSLEKSKLNLTPWKDFGNSKSIKLIENELSEFII